MRRLTILLLLAVILSVTVSATELVPQQVCSCGLTVDTIRVVNDKDSSQSYTVELAGDAAPYSLVYPSSFTLPANGKIDINLNFHVPCIDNKAYVLGIKITESESQSSTITKAFLAKKCAPIQVFATEPGKVSGPCEKVYYRFDITNTGNEADIFQFSTDNNYVTLSTDAVKLNPGRSHTLMASVELDCNDTGLKEFSLITENSAMRATTPFALEIVPSYDYTLVRPKILELCEGLETSVPFVVNNKESFSNSYSMEFSGVDFSPESTLVDVKAHDKNISNVTFLAPIGSAGDYDVKIHMLSTAGVVEKNVTMPVKVKDCYSYNITAVVPSGKVCCDSTSIPIEIRHEGSSDIAVNLALESDSFTLADETIMLDGATSGSTALLLNEGSCTESAVFKLSASLKEGFEKELSGNVEFVPITDCSRLSVSKSDYEINYKQASITIPVKNIGAKSTYYEFALNAGSWEYLETFDMNLDPGEVGEVRVYVDPRDIPADTYALELTATTANGEEFLFPISLTLKSDLSCKDHLWNTYVYMVNNPFTFAFRLLGILFVALVILLIVLSWWRGDTKKIKRRAKLKKAVRILAYLLLVIVLVAGAVYLFYNYGLEPVTTYMPENTTVKNESDFKFEIPRGEFDLNLTEIFTDPDADVLYYTVVGPKTLDIKVDNSQAMAKVTPTPDFVEGSTIIVIVSDGEYSITSPPITLVYADDVVQNNGGIPAPYVYTILILLVVFLFARVIYDQYQEKKKMPSAPKRNLSLSDLKGKEPKKKRGRPRKKK